MRRISIVGSASTVECYYILVSPNQEFNTRRFEEMLLAIVLGLHIY
jgi:hypothetical protein